MSPVIREHTMSNDRRTPIRKFLALGAASFALFGAIQAMAADSTFTYDIGATCEVRDLDNVDVSVSNLPGASGLPGERFTLICDDPNGAGIELTTANGGLLHEDGSSLVNYNAFVRGPGLNFPYIFTNGTPRTSPRFPQDASAALADPNNFENVTLSVSFPDSFTFSGVYTDTLSINIAGNP